MNIVFSDEDARLSQEIRDKMREAALAILGREVFLYVNDEVYEESVIETEDSDIEMLEESIEKTEDYAEDSYEEDCEEAIVRAREANIEIGVSVVSSEEIKELNREYRGKDSVTDVLSFPQFKDVQEVIDNLSNAESDRIFDTSDFEGMDTLADITEEEEAISDDVILLGDVVLCYDQAVKQAEEYGTGMTRELVYLFTHSVLHLLGYDHEEEDERRLMRRREEEIMNVIGISK